VEFCKKKKRKKKNCYITTICTQLI
jgi:hypothetical protein